jgi:hypothetical protein
MKIKGWSRNRKAEIKKTRRKLILELDSLDVKVEQYPLSEDDQERRNNLNMELDKSWRIEETKAW